MKLLVTGGAGFIGSHFVRHMLGRSDVQRLINLDKLTYAGHLENLKDVANHPRYRFVRGDIASVPGVDKLMGQVDAVVNFAAETHVDRSIHDASPFLHTNVVGVHVLLDAARRAGVRRFVHISTDEVYGSIGRGTASEKAPLSPGNPYSASKAAADFLVLSYFHTHRMPVMITRAGNNYGPYQYPEKFLPLFITHALEGRPLPLYGDGRNIREWLHVADHCAGIEKVLRRGRPGEVYNIGTGRGYPNIQVARMILKLLGRSPNLLKYVPDRPGHDRRYAMSIAKMTRELGWKPAIGFSEGLRDLIRWYQSNRAWWEPILNRSKQYQQFYKKQYARSAK
jgi:dTDP-glucose 4,6-dehydratase